MSANHSQPIGLIVRQAPYAQRDPRSQLDVALAAAAIELPLEIFLLGDGIWQLAANRDAGPAQLPSGLKGWAAIGEMTAIRFFAEPEHCDRLQALGTVVPLEALDLPGMSRRWQDCLRVMAL